MSHFSGTEIPDSGIEDGGDSSAIYGEWLIIDFISGLYYGIIEEYGIRRCVGWFAAFRLSPTPPSHSPICSFAGAQLMGTGHKRVDLERASHIAYDIEEEAEIVEASEFNPEYQI